LPTPRYDQPDTVWGEHGGTRYQGEELRANSTGQAIGVAANEKGGVQVISKKPASANKPASSLYTVTYGGNKSARKSVATSLQTDQRRAPC